MSNIEFKQIWKPWIGSNFENSEFRLMLIGESHYADNDETYRDFLNNENTTIDIINRLKNGDKWKFFPNTYKALIGDGEININEFWSKVGFYNLIQRPMKSMNERPSQSDFKNYLKTAIDIIDNSQTKPTHLIFLGNSSERYFDSIIIENLKFTLLKNDKEKIGRYWAAHKTIKFDTNVINVFFIKHPSKYFSWSKWNLYLKTKEPKFSVLKN